VLLVVLIYGLGQLIESFVLTPRLVGERIGLGPLAVIFALARLRAAVRVRGRADRAAGQRGGGRCPAARPGQLPREPALHRMKQIPLAITPAVEARFDTLLAGPNAEVVQHVRTLMPPSAPVYLWGPTGSGKTHLLAALAERFQVAGERVGWFGPAEPLPWALEEGWALVVVDECDLLDAQQQQAAFAHCSWRRARHGVQWAAAGRLPPVDLPLRDDLRTRLGWGHVFGAAAAG
jgi:chromosomal replication initiation ATPase DnaA